MILSEKRCSIGLDGRSRRPFHCALSSSTNCTLCRCSYVSGILKIDFPDVKEYIDKRFLIIVVGAGKGEFYHHVLDSKWKEWEVFDSNEFATWDTHTHLVTVLKEELPRSFLNFRIVLNNSAKSNIYWRQGSWVSAPATVVKFVETLIRISWCHHVDFSRT